MEPSNFPNALSFSVFQNTHHETNFLSNCIYFQSSIDYKNESSHLKQLLFLQKYFFLRKSCWLEYFVFFLIVTLWYQILFLISYFLKINTFSAQLLFRRSFFSRKSNYSEHVLFRGRCFFQTSTFSKNFFRTRYSWKETIFSDNSA